MKTALVWARTGGAGVALIRRPVATADVAAERTHSGTLVPGAMVDERFVMTPRRRNLVIAMAVLVIVALVWQFRWGIGLRAIRIVDPVVRRWASGEVERLSDGAYRLVATPIRVDVGQRRIAVDTITITTDAAANARRDAPLPALSLRFDNCALEGVDLDRLAAGRGLSVDRLGCDTVTVVGEVPRGVSRDTTTSFLSLSEDLDLSRRVPSIEVDSIRFPSVKVRLGIAGRSGRRTAFSFERLAVMLDSLHYRRKLPEAERRTLYSRNATLRLDDFSGAREANDRLDVASIRADLATRSFVMLGFAWAPLPGAFADSLGLRELEVDTLALGGVDWRAFLVNGDAVVQTLVVRGVRIAMSASHDSTTGNVSTPSGDKATSAARWVLERTLRTIDRGIRLDSLDAHDVRVSQPLGDTVSVVEADTLIIAGTRFGFDPSTWDGPEPLGPVRLVARGVSREWQDYRTALDRLDLDLGAGTASVTGMTHGTTGTDADFVRRRRWRSDRISVEADTLLLSGIDAAAWVKRHAYRAVHLGVSGLHLDVFNDKRRPSRGAVATRRYPQEWLRTSGLDLHVDSATIAGRITYRERGAQSRTTGVLRFESVIASLANLGNDPTRLRGDTTVRIRATARLMGAAPIRVNISLPTFARRFEMNWSGTVGTMPATAFNELVTSISSLRFNNGTIDGVEFSAATRNGVSSGTVRPRWRDLSVELPGIARTGILQGLRRAIAKFAANQFVVRADNFTGMPNAEPVNGTISHRWTPRETLLQHLWNSLRDALLVTIRL